MARLTLYPEQEEIVQRVLAEPTKAFLNGSQQSQGKTVMTSEIIARSGWGRVLLVGVKDTAGQWSDSLRDQSDGRIELKVIDARKAGQKHLADMLSGEPGIYFMGIELFVSKDWEHRDKLDPSGERIQAIKKSTGELLYKKDGTPQWERERVQKHIYRKMKTPLDAFIGDELHKLAANRKGVGRRTLVSVKTIWKGALSGTWHGNSFENAWSPTQWLWPEHIDPSFHRWKKEWCREGAKLTREGRPAYRIGRGGEPEPVIEIKGEKNPGAFAASLPCYFRLEGEPVPDPEIVYVDLSPVQRAQYAQMERDSLMWLAQRFPNLSEEQLYPLVAELPISQRQRLRTAAIAEMSMTEDEEVTFSDDAKSTKLEALSGLLAHYGKQKVVIYTDSKRAAKLAVGRMKRAGLSVAEWSGDVKSDEREKIKQEFMTPLPEGGLQYIVAVISAFGTGLDGFQKHCSKVIWLSEMEGNAVENDQAIFRIWRRGGDYENFQHVKILARDTLDDGVFMNTKAKGDAMLLTMRKLTA